MKTKKAAFSQSYLVALRNHLERKTAPGLEAARELGLQAVTLGLAMLDLAKIHEEALITLVSSHFPARVREGVVRRGVAFFTEAITPIEETHSGARAANVHMKFMIGTLTQRTKQLAASNEKLKCEIAQRKIVEDSLRTSELTSSRLLAKSRDMQEELRLLSRRILSVQEEERKRISRELHDIVAQTLTGINVRLATLKAQSSTDVKNLYRKIEATQRLVQKSVDIVHRFARDLRPTLLDDLGLVPALRSHLKVFGEQTGIAVDFVASTGVEQLDGAGRTALYRVVQEALANIARHAKTGCAQVRLASRNGLVCLDIRDNGKGFLMKEVALTKNAKRLGLLGMRERVEMVGGTFSVKSAPGKGTHIRVEIPNGGGPVAKKQPPTRSGRTTVKKP